MFATMKSQREIQSKNQAEEHRMTEIQYSSDKYITLTEAAEAIESGDTIWLGSSLSISNDFLWALSKRNDELENVTLLTHKPQNPNPMLTHLKYLKAFHLASFMGSYSFSENSDAGVPGFRQTPYGTFSRMICETFKVNTIVTELCPPDEAGNCDYGTFGTGTTPYISNYEGITKTIAILNSHQPSGNTAKIHLENVDYICESEHALPCISPTQNVFCGTPA